ncbi:tryptophan--tRNA ligase [Hujiaoplasma nucleasis]|uniref:Tryptophan--tRNA ligase n=1 Tax=Hujiaoplasma nucleasis TaxID=2725268 RepID=A0A7L6N307_9MOLU|nr:tryptophan--tRNA ligase [Hujiaoplasma nucleasis]QLY39445.1 tryptophan--tRNA ligase [Hujiaoplasma nucleasis]
MKRIVSGIKPTGSLTLGNYIGAIKQFVKLQKERKDDEFFLFIADLHAITIRQVPHELRQRTLDIAAMYLACGLDEEKTVLFIQSEVPQHVELGYILQSNVYMGELERMTQFKDKAQKGQESITSSLFTYPALMAADILLYDADYVPVGDDQKQHLELTRDIAERFNHYYNNFFTVPEPIIPKVGARIMDLQDPNKKMSKSEDNPKGYITLFDNENLIKKKIASAVTDSLAIIQFDPINQPGLANLINIFASMSDQSIEEIVEKYKESSYKNFKEDLGQAIVDVLKPIQEKYQALIKSDKLQEILDKGRDTANQYAFKKMRKCKQKIGLGRK